MRLTELSATVLRTLWLHQRVMSMRSIIADLLQRHHTRYDVKKVYAALDYLQTKELIACSCKLTDWQSRLMWGITPVGSEIVRSQLNIQNVNVLTSRKQPPA